MVRSGPRFRGPVAIEEPPVPMPGAKAWSRSWRRASITPITTLPPQVPISAAHAPPAITSKIFDIEMAGYTDSGHWCIFYVDWRISFAFKVDFFAALGLC
jgi:hypothetical protein